VALDHRHDDITLKLMKFCIIHLQGGLHPGEELVSILLGQ